MTKHIKRFETKDGNTLYVEYGISGKNFSIIGVLIKGITEKETYKGIDDKRWISFGRIHNIIKETTNEFNDLIPFHLADSDTGEPMYADENGWYHLNTPEITANLLRVSVETIENLRNEIRSMKNQKLHYLVFVDKQRERWEREAKEIKEKYNLV